MKRIHLEVRGVIQGVGFRPFVYRLACELGLRGWVRNSAQGVAIEVEGGEDDLGRFIERLQREPPPTAAIHQVKTAPLPATGDAEFAICHSDGEGGTEAVVAPDLAPCADCLRELRDPANRRYRYPFINCTHCGPRYTILEALPYDRPNTSMKRFALCAECEAEYRDPRDRRFHAQPNACPRCGPGLTLRDASGRPLAMGEEALKRAAHRVREGGVVALKGMGGFQLIVNACDEEAVRRLRQRKHRGEKPFALMVASLREARRLCEISPLEETLLLSQEAPIVLLSRTGEGTVAPAVAPGNPWLGIMLPSTPLHHLWMDEFGFPVVATSGNRAGEPICINDAEAILRLCGIADAFLVHDRPIVRPVDDSVVRIVAGRELVLRRARGYAPSPVRFTGPLPPILAVGAHLKNTVALGRGQNGFLSQHLGDLETAEAHAAFRRAAENLPCLYGTKVAAVACDLHPDYLSTRYAVQSGRPMHPVQHHWAHVAACMAENGLEAPVLGIAWDGSGFGPDGTIWGGEFLLAEGRSFRRAAHLRPFTLPGGEAAVREPRRSALGLLHAMFGESLWEPQQEREGEKFASILANFSRAELAVLRRMLSSGGQAFNVPRTSSMGRLFDAVAALAGFCQRAGYEGQAAIELEAAARPEVTECYPFTILEKTPLQLDWEPMIRALLADRAQSVSPAVISAKFHNMLARSAAALALKIAEEIGNKRVVLTGGCFQNGFLTERIVTCLREAGLEPYWHSRIPPNDGGLALGQLAAAAWMLDCDTPDLPSRHDYP